MIEFLKYDKADIERFADYSLKSLTELHEDICRRDAVLMWHGGRVLKASSSIQLLMTTGTRFLCETHRQFEKGVPGHEDGIIPTNCPYTVSGQRQRGEEAPIAVAREVLQETSLTLDPSDPMLEDLSQADEREPIRPSRVYYNIDSFVTRRRYQWTIPKNLEIPNPLNKDNGVLVFCRWYDEAPPRLREWLDPYKLVPKSMK